MKTVVIVHIEQGIIQKVYSNEKDIRLFVNRWVFHKERLFLEGEVVNVKGLDTLDADIRERFKKELGVDLMCLSVRKSNKSHKKGESHESI